MTRRKRLSPVPLTGIYDIRHIKKAKGQRNLMGMDSGMYLRVQKVRSEMDREIESLGITEKKIHNWRHGGSVIDWDKLTPNQKEKLHKQNALLTARSIFSRYFEEFYTTPEEKAKWKKERERMGLK